MVSIALPAVDFYSQLSGLGDTLQANAKLRQQQQIGEARKAAFSDFTALDPSSPDYGKQTLTVAQKLGSVGDQDGALKFLTLAQTAADRAHSIQREGVTDQHWNQDFGLRKAAAARADDPTPDNFVADSSAPGGYRPIGPADPAYKASVAKAEATAKADVPTVIGAGSSVVIPNKAAEGAIFTNRFNGGGLSEDARDIKARQLINGDMSGLTNIGRGAQAGKTLEEISNRAAEILMQEKGMSQDDAAAHLGKQVQAFKASSMGQGAEARTAGVREANLNLILRAADAAIPAALEASDKVSRTGFVPLNKVIQGGQVVSSDPELKRFGMANLQLAEHWARAMNPTGVMRESDRDKALSFLSTADSKDTYRQAVDQLRTQILRERDAVKSAPMTPTGPAFRPDQPVKATNAAGQTLVFDPNRKMWIPEGAQ